MSAYDGMTFLGTVEVHLGRKSRRFSAFAPDGRKVGTYRTQIAATRALPTITTTITNEQARHLAKGAGPKQARHASPMYARDAGRTSA